MNSAASYMPLFVADYLADTAHLSAVEHGAYLLLIMNYWQRGKPLPADDAKLMRIARVSASEWASIRPSLEEFFDEHDGLWTHKRVESELAVFADKIQKARAAGKASAERRSNVRSTPAERTLDSKVREEKEDTGSSLRSDPRPIADANGPVADASPSDPTAPSKPSRQRKPYTPDFEEFWKAYPTDANMSKQEAFDAWQRISPDERRDATLAIPKYRAFCRNDPTYRVLHACRFLSKRRAEGFLDSNRRGQDVRPNHPVRTAQSSTDLLMAAFAREAGLGDQGNMEAGGFDRPSPDDGGTVVDLEADPRTGAFR